MNRHLGTGLCLYQRPKKAASRAAIRHRKYITASQFDATGNPRLFDLRFVRFGQGWARDAIEADRKNTGTVRSDAFLPGLPAVTVGVEVISIVSFPDIP